MSQHMPQRRGAKWGLDQWWNHVRERGSMDVKVRAYVRSFAPACGRHYQRGSLIERLQTAVDDGRIDSFEMTVLGKELCTCSHCRAQEETRQLLETVEELKDWEHGTMQSTGFIEREICSSVIGEEYTTIVPPETIFGIYLEESLVGVFPCIIEGETYGPEVYLDKLDAEQQTQAEERNKELLKQ